VATIRPFKALRYNTARLRNISYVLTQPYDRINAEEQAKYYELSPYNFTRIIKGREYADDDERYNVYTRARSYARAWRAQRVLMRESRPAIYVHDQSYLTSDGKEHTRRGFSAALQLTGFKEGMILPHERTLSGPKVDRLELTRVTETGWGHVFVLYPDDENRINGILDAAVADLEPMMAEEKIIEQDVIHRFWIIDDPKAISAVVTEMAPKRNLIIADGHHRYETALNYRAEMRDKYPDHPEEAAFNHTVATLVSMSDPGLVILPTHRLIHSYAKLSGAEVVNKAGQFFDVLPMPDRAALERVLGEAAPHRPSFGWYDGGYALFRLREADVLAQILPDRAPEWRMLDAAVLHELLIERVLGIDSGAVERKENIDYLRDPDAGFARVDAGDAQFLLLMNPTRMEQVRACTAVGERMPQKSTDFYPKVLSGLVALPLGAGEILE